MKRPITLSDRRELNYSKPIEVLSKRRRLYFVKGMHISGGWDIKEGKKPYFKIEKVYRPEECIPVAKGDTVKWQAAMKREKGGGTGKVYDVLPSGAIVVAYKWVIGDSALTRKVRLAPWQITRNLTTESRTNM